LVAFAEKGQSRDWRSPDCSTWNNLEGTSDYFEELGEIHKLFDVPRETSCNGGAALLDFRIRVTDWHGLSRLQTKKVELGRQRQR